MSKKTGYGNDYEISESTGVSFAGLHPSGPKAGLVYYRYLVVF
jgi:hypothetical protein